ncbi:MAG: TolC family protein, partial [Pseudomonadota bacterium]
VTRTDVEQARARLAASRSTLAANEGSLENSIDSYRRNVGKDPGKLLPPPPIPELPDSEAEAIAIGLQNDPALLFNRIEREATGFDVKAAIGNLLPQVSIQGSTQQFNTFEDDIGDATARTAAVGVFVTIPFYSGGANYSAVRQAQASVEGAEANITTEMRNVRQSVGLAWASLRVARAQIRAGNLEVRAAELAFEGVREEAKVGARTTLDVLDAEQETLDARAGLITAQRDEYVAAYQLLQAMGLLTVDHMGLDVGDAGNDPNYYDSVRNRNFSYDQTDDTVWTLDWRP